MSLNALVIANAAPENHRVLYAISRQLRELDGVKPFVYETLEGAHQDHGDNFNDYAFVIADGPSINNDFRAAAALLPNKPAIILQNPDSPLPPAEAKALGLNPDLVLKRPFCHKHLRATIENVVNDLTLPMSLRGLFTNKACTNVFFDGTPLMSLMETERDLLAFLINHKTARMSRPKLIEAFRKNISGTSHYGDDQVLCVLERFSKRLEKRLPDLTYSAYGIKRSYDRDQKFKGCHLVQRV